MIADELIKIEKSKPVTAEMPVMEFDTPTRNGRVYDSKLINIPSGAKINCGPFTVEELEDIRSLSEDTAAMVKHIEDTKTKEYLETMDRLRAEMEPLYSDNEIVARTILGLDQSNLIYPGRFKN